MDHRPIPHTDLHVSPLCLGTMTFGNPVDAEDAIRLVHWALDHGINFIDTADMYEGYSRKPGSTGGVAEQILGCALRDRRDQAVITTKVGCEVESGSGLSRQHIFEQIDASLRRLGTDRVDIYQMHKPDPSTPLIESLAAMAWLIEIGKIRHWGFSNFEPNCIREMIELCDRHNWPRPVASQPRYNWLDRAIESEHLPLCHQLSIAVTPYQPLAGGLLTGKYRSGSAIPAGSRISESDWLGSPDAQLYKKLDAFAAEAQAHQTQETAYAIDWLLEQPGVTSVVAGCKSIEQLTGIMGARR